MAFDDLVNNYPMIEAQIANKEFSINENGNVKTKFTVSHHFRGPDGARWEVTSPELWVDEDAGIQNASVVDMKVIRNIS